MRKDVIAGILVLATALTAAIAFVVREAQWKPPEASPPQAIAMPEPAAPRPRRAPSTVPLAIATPEPALLPPSPPVAAPPPKPRPVASAQPQPVNATDARAALALVGADEQAEAYWIDAINDNTNLSDGERKNLIEDLNETGFDDPRNLTATDLPMIEYRMALIEDLANDAIDDVNAAAFQEAYKDLVNMRARLVPGP